MPQTGNQLMQNSTFSNGGIRLAILVNSMRGGGAERAALRLADSFVEVGYEVDLLLLSPKGPYLDEIGCSLSVFSIQGKVRFFSRLSNCFKLRKYQQISASFFEINSAKKTLSNHFSDYAITDSYACRALSISHYLRTHNPNIILASMHNSNIAAIHGIYLAKSSIPLIISIQNNVHFDDRRDKIESKAAYRYADAVVCISHGVTESVNNEYKLPDSKLYTIYNPIPYCEIQKQSKANVCHPWFVDSKFSVIFSVGRMVPQKDHFTLISAFAEISKEKPEARLVIMTNYVPSKCEMLFSHADTLNIREKIDILKFDLNPFRYMKRSNCFVLSSIHEGLSYVLVEAMACGTPIISTDCPYGPREVLENGRWGKLVPIRNPKRLAEAILMTLNGDRICESQLKKRARNFSKKKSTDAYIKLFDSLLN